MLPPGVAPSVANPRDRRPHGLERRADISFESAGGLATLSDWLFLAVTGFIVWHAVRFRDESGSPDMVRLLLNASTVARSDTTAIMRAVERSLEDPSAGSNARRTVASRMFYRPGTATVRAVQCVYDALELESAAVERAPTGMLPHASELSSRTAHHV